jgi:formyl-CoA transferase
MLNHTALSGIRVLDMTHVQAGPSASQLLAWLGADVIKVESPTGDVTRSQLQDIPGTDGLYFNMMNCNKRSVVIDMKSVEGKTVFTDLLKKCDIVIENFGPGALTRLGFSWQRIHEINPAIIMGSIKGFGENGPYSNFKAYDNISQAMGGSMSTTGFDQGVPLVTGSQVGDIGSGLHLIIGVLAALQARNTTGQGQHVEVAMMDVVMNFCRIKFRDHQRLARGPLPEYMTPTQNLTYAPRSGNESGGSNMGSALKCKPGGVNDYIYVVVQDAVWQKLAIYIGGDALAQDPRFVTLDNRNKNQLEMWHILEKFTSRHTKFEIMQMLNELDVPCGPVMSTEDLVNNEYVKLREMIVELNHPQRGSWFNIGMPIKLSNSYVAIGNPPGLGEHTEEILRDVLGYDNDKIHAYRK